MGTRGLWKWLRQDVTQLHYYDTLSALFLACKLEPKAGVIYTKPNSKIAEHGGFSDEDTHVALLLLWAGMSKAAQIDTPVQTTQVAPTILKALGLDPNALQGIKAENTAVLPDIGQ